jgi:dsRNA-specific ribonuclease
MTFESESYQGIRGPRFRTFLTQILRLSGLKSEYIDKLLDDQGMKYYACAFTHKTADPENNYEWLEFLGDVTLNKAIAWYLTQRFPQLNCAEGVKILTRLKINLISKRSFAHFAKQLHFWEFISGNGDVRHNKQEKTLEDVFEAFFGATELILNEKVRPGTGEHICYRIIASLLDTSDLSLRYTDLFDAKTRLKEVFDYYGVDQLGKQTIEADRVDGQYTVHLFRVHNGNKQLLASGQGPLKSDAAQQASERAIEFLKKQGYERPIGENYARFCPP